MAAGNLTKEDITQDQILRAARVLFEKHGFQKVTMDDVARSVGKGRSSLYYYYKSKDEVFDAVIHEEISDIIAALEHAISLVNTAAEKIRAFCIAKIKEAKKKKSFFSAMEAGMDAGEVSRYMQIKLAVRKRLLSEETALLRGVIHSGIETGELPAMAPKDLDLKVYVLLCSMHGLKREMLMENSFGRVTAAADTLTHMAIQGMKG